MNELPILILKDSDIFSDVATNNELPWRLREAVKIIVFDGENKIALVGITRRLLPGGGVEEGETFEEAAKRECLEEIGCNIEITCELGFTEEYRTKDSRHQITYGFVAKVIGEKGLPETTQEDEQGMQIDWLILEDAAALLLKQKDEFTQENYNACFNVRTHLAFLNKFDTIFGSAIVVGM